MISAAQASKLCVRCDLNFVEKRKRWRERERREDGREGEGRRREGREEEERE